MAGGVDVKIDRTKLTAKITDLRKVTDQAMPQVYEFFVRETPIAQGGGNAREHTVYHANRIIADYPYAAVLDAGRGYRDGQMRGSEQAPHGMTEPTREFAQKLIPQLIKKLGSK